MKVIQQGRAQRGWSKELRCTGEGNKGGGCNALLLVEQDDVFVTTSSARDEVDYYNTFRCSECGVLTDIKDRLPFEPHRKEPEHSRARKP